MHSDALHMELAEMRHACQRARAEVNDLKAERVLQSDHFASILADYRELMLAIREWARCDYWTHEAHMKEGLAVIKAFNKLQENSKDKV